MRCPVDFLAFLLGGWACGPELDAAVLLGLPLPLPLPLPVSLRKSGVERETLFGSSFENEENMFGRMWRRPSYVGGLWWLTYPAPSSMNWSKSICRVKCFDKHLPVAEFP